MTDPLAVGTGDSVTFPDALMAGDSGLKCLVSEQVAVPALSQVASTGAWSRARPRKVVIPKLLAMSPGLAAPPWIAIRRCERG